MSMPRFIHLTEFYANRLIANIHGRLVLLNPEKIAYMTINRRWVMNTREEGALPVTERPQETYTCIVFVAVSNEDSMTIDVQETPDQIMKQIHYAYMEEVRQS